MTKSYGVHTRDPRDPFGEKTTVWFPGELILGYYKKDPTHYANIETAVWVLESPLLIFEGVRQLNKGGWCFVGKPPQWYVADRVVATFPEKLVYSVYINPSLYVYNFRADEVDASDARYPLDWRNRYRREIWPATS